MMCSVFDVQVSAVNPETRQRSLFDLTVVAVDEDQARNDVLRMQAADYWQWQVRQVRETRLDEEAIAS